MLKAALIDNGVVGTTRYFRDSEQVRYRVERVADAWSPDFSRDDLVIVPNGADHVALYEVRDRIAAFLARGATLACFCGFFTPWIPGNVWVHDNTRSLREVRYRLVNDPLHLMDGVDLEQLTFESHGISGWWACGHIQTADPESIVLADNFGRVVMVADMTSTPGLIVATASGPLGDWDPTAQSSGLQRLYRNIIRAASARQERLHA